jgi:A-factor type gamma-butyrolactone 1'-reductase (1S-forming)
MTSFFHDKVAVVTGATSGMGQATAELFAKRGASVVLAGRREERGEALAKAIRAAGGEATFIRTDVADPRSVESLFEQTIRRYGRLDCAFNNAGVPGNHLTATPDQTLDSWNEVININLRGVWLCMQHELRYMGEHGGGAVVNTASVYSHIGTGLGISPYVASKHGVLGLTRAAATEFASSGIRVNAVSPGMIRTEMTAPSLETYADSFNAAIQQLVLLKRIGEPPEVATAVLWLCSDEASYVTGQTLVVDGGWLSH